MELEELKLVMEYQAQKISPASEKYLQQMLQKKMVGTIHKLIKSLHLEIIAAGIFLIIVLAGMASLQGNYSLITGLLSIIYTVFFLSYLYFLLSKLRQFEQQPLPTFDYLKDIIQLLTRFSNTYLSLCRLFPPVMFLLSLGFLIQYHAEYTVHFRALFHSGTFWTLISGFLIWGIFQYKFAGWYIQNRFGRHLIILKADVQELSKP